MHKKALINVIALKQFLFVRASKYKSAYSERPSAGNLHALPVSASWRPFSCAGGAACAGLRKGQQRLSSLQQLRFGSRVSDMPSHGNERARTRMEA